MVVSSSLELTMLVKTSEGAETHQYTSEGAETHQYLTIEVAYQAYGAQLFYGI